MAPGSVAMAERSDFDVLAGLGAEAALLRDYEGLLADLSDLAATGPVLRRLARLLTPVRRDWAGPAWRGGGGLAPQP